MDPREWVSQEPENKDQGIHVTAAWAEALGRKPDERRHLRGLLKARDQAWQQATPRMPLKELTSSNFLSRSLVASTEVILSYPPAEFKIPTS